MNDTVKYELYRILESRDPDGRSPLAEISWSTAEHMTDWMEALWEYCLHYRLPIHFGLYMDEMYALLQEQDGDPEQPARLFRNLVETVRTLRSKMDNNRQKMQAETVIFELKNYIRNHLDQDLSLMKLAERTFYNASYLSRLFKQISGYTIAQYIEFMKLEKAKDELKYTDYSIRTVAEHIGIASPRYFSYFFKEKTDESPRDYRRRYQNEQTDRGSF